MYSPVWEAEDAKLLKSCRQCSGLSEADFARAHSISVLQLRELEGNGAGRFYTDDIKARAGLKMLAKYGHVKYIPPLVVRNELRSELQKTRPITEKGTQATQRNRREVAMLGSCAALVAGVFVMLPQIEGKADAQLASNRPALSEGMQVANTLTGQRSVPINVPIELKEPLNGPMQDTQMARTPLVPDALPATAAGPGTGSKALSEDARQSLAPYFQASGTEPSSVKP